MSLIKYFVAWFRKKSLLVQRPPSARRPRDTTSVTQVLVTTLVKGAQRVYINNDICSRVQYDLIVRAFLLSVEVLSKFLLILVSINISTKFLLGIKTCFVFTYFC